MREAEGRGRESHTYSNHKADLRKMEGRKGRHQTNRILKTVGKKRILKEKCMKYGKRATMLYSDFAKHLTSCHKISLLNQFKLLWMGTLTWTET